MPTILTPENPLGSAPVDAFGVDGAFGFYRGVWAHVLRSTPQATITLLFYEYGQRILAWGGRYRTGILD